jgi:hypothetical protein
MKNVVGMVWETPHRDHSYLVIDQWCGRNTIFFHLVDMASGKQYTAHRVPVRVDLVENGVLFRGATDEESAFAMRAMLAPETLEK